MSSRNQAESVDKNRLAAKIDSATDSAGLYAFVLYCMYLNVIATKKKIFKNNASILFIFKEVILKNNNK